MPSPASTTTTTANTAFCWPGDSSIALRYFLRRTGRSQNGSGVSGALAPPPPSRSAAAAGADRGASSPDPAGPLLPIQPLEGRIGPGCQRGRDGAADHDPPPEPSEPLDGRPLAGRGREPLPLPLLLPPPLLPRLRVPDGRPPKVDGVGGGAGAGPAAGGGGAGRLELAPDEPPPLDHHDPPERDVDERLADWVPDPVPVGAAGRAVDAARRPAAAPGRRHRTDQKRLQEQEQEQVQEQVAAPGWVRPGRAGSSPGGVGPRRCGRPRHCGRCHGTSPTTRRTRRALRSAAAG